MPEDLKEQRVAEVFPVVGSGLDEKAISLTSEQSVDRSHLAKLAVDLKSPCVQVKRFLKVLNTLGENPYASLTTSMLTSDGALRYLS